MKLSIIIVSWNVAEQLEQCLASVFFALKTSLSFEVIVVDNASSDESADKVRTHYPDAILIANPDNKGFGAACNQGIRIARGEYLCFLNPDTEVDANALQTLVAFLDSHRDVGMVAPRITFPDGIIQRSVRRFPTALSLLAIFFKLDRILPFLAPVRRYYADDFDYTLTQEVDQPMGACLMTRKKVLDSLGVFDEQFFIWFEEVDLCKRIKESGSKIMYVADASITHQRARSFSKQDLLTRQRNFYTSARVYLNKHYPNNAIAYLASGIFHAYTALISFVISLRASIPMSREGTLFDMRVFACVFLVIEVIEFISLLVYTDHISGVLAFVVVTVIACILALWRLDIAVGILLAELVIGSKGYLFSIDSWDWRLPIRMALFATVMLAWAYHVSRTIIGAARNKRPLLWPAITRSRFLWWYVAIGGSIAYGFIAGYIFGHPVGNIIRDGNAWLFFLVVPAFYEAFRNRASISFLTALIAAGLATQTIKVLLTFYVMGHSSFTNAILTPWYHWIRHTGVGEITSLPSTMTRVFFQSQIFALAGLACIGAFALIYFMRQCDERKEAVWSAIAHACTHYRWIVMFSSVLSASVIVSFSRSLWLAGVAAVIILMVWALTLNGTFKALAGFIFMTGMSIGVGLLLLVGISSIPFPATSGVFDIRSLQERVSDVDDEAAAVSRWRLLPELMKAIQNNPIAGYGFGKTVTYDSKDPRIASGSASGSYTTFAFEWGYLDIWIKLGIIGLALYSALLFAVMLQGFLLAKILRERKRFWDAALALGVSMAIITVAITHVFTPYLNHPLGIGILIVAGIMIERLMERPQS